MHEKMLTCGGTYLLEMTSSIVFFNKPAQDEGGAKTDYLSKWAEKSEFGIPKSFGVLLD